MPGRANGISGIQGDVAVKILGAAATYKQGRVISSGRAYGICKLIDGILHGL